MFNVVVVFRDIQNNILHIKYFKQFYVYFIYRVDNASIHSFEKSEPIIEKTKPPVIIEKEENINQQNQIETTNTTQPYSNQQPPKPEQPQQQYNQPEPEPKPENPILRKFLTQIQ